MLTLNQDYKLLNDLEVHLLWARSYLSKCLGSPLPLHDSLWDQNLPLQTLTRLSKFTFRTSSNKANDALKFPAVLSFAGSESSRAFSFYNGRGRKSRIVISLELLTLVLGLEFNTEREKPVQDARSKAEPHCLSITC